MLYQPLPHYRALPDEDVDHAFGNPRFQAELADPDRG